MRSASRRLAAALPLLLGTVVSARTEAIEVPSVGGKPLSIDVTNTAVFDYRFNNRNDGDLDIPRQVDDFYGEWLDRLNVQATWWRFRLGVRVDAAVFWNVLTRDQIADMVAGELRLPDPQKANARDRIVFNDKVNGFASELHTRFRRAIYPSKLFLGYSQPGVDVTVGDFYVQLGRGLVFSVRKVDELAIDTTVRGVKVVADKSFGDLRFGATLFGGQLNPLRVDETSGRRLHGAGSPLFFGFPVAGNLQTYDISQPGIVRSFIDLPQPSYIEDTAVGGRLELGTRWFSVSANTAVLLRKSYAEDKLRCLQKLADAGGDDSTIAVGDPVLRGLCASRYPDFSTTDPSKKHNRIVNVSGAVNVPSLAKHGDLYVEVAGQHMGDGQVTALAKGAPVREDNLAGYAIYANASITGGPVSVSLEGKHYRNFFPLSAHIDTVTPGVAAPELALVTFSQPPTAEPIYTQIVGGGSPGVCVTGGRGRVDYRFDRHTSVYAWLGRYASWSEKPAALDNGCEVTAAQRTDTWDTAVGADLGLNQSRSHLNAWVGARSTDQEPALDARGRVASTAPGDLPTFYREGYVRYDVVKHLTGPLSLQFQGFHRHRYEPLLSPDPWTEGENYTALQWSPHFSFIFGYEYLIRQDCQPARSATLSEEARASKSVCHYVNGGVQWRASGDGTGAKKVLGQLFNSVNLFVGQRRAAIRCVSGVCRQFPPFEGARLEITSRF